MVSVMGLIVLARFVDVDVSGSGIELFDVTHCALNWLLIALGYTFLHELLSISIGLSMIAAHLPQPISLQRLHLGLSAVFESGSHDNSSVRYVVSTLASARKWYMIPSTCIVAAALF